MSTYVTFSDNLNSTTHAVSSQPKLSNNFGRKYRFAVKVPTRISVSLQEKKS